MEYRQIDPDMPSIGRWISLNRKHPRHSTLRMLEYEALEKMELKGTLLDVGGGENSRYRKNLPSEIEYSSVNIDPDINPTWLVEPGKKLPIKSNTFDMCMSMNTLEHVYDPKFLVGEIFRILKPGGKVIITVPWIFCIHGHPDDYTRATPSWWRTTLEDTGFSSGEVQPLVWGRYSTAASISGYRMGLFGLRRHFTHFKDFVYAAITIHNTNGKYSGKRGQRICNVAPGHFIVAVK